MAGLGLIDEALVIADANSESWCNVELHRERGELLLMAAGEEAENQADAEFKAAIETAIAQGAKLSPLSGKSPEQLFTAKVECDIQSAFSNAGTESRGKRLSLNLNRFAE